MTLEEQLEQIKHWPDVVDAWLEDDRYANILLKDVGPPGKIIHERVQICFDMKMDPKVVKNNYYADGAIRIVGSKGGVLSGYCGYPQPGHHGPYYVCFGGGLWAASTASALKNQDVGELLSIAKHFMHQSDGPRGGWSGWFEESYSPNLKLPIDMKPMEYKKALKIAEEAQGFTKESKVKRTSKVLKELGIE